MVMHIYIWVVIFIYIYVQWVFVIFQCTGMSVVFRLRGGGEGVLSGGSGCLPF